MDNEGLMRLNIITKWGVTISLAEFCVFMAIKIVASEISVLFFKMVIFLIFS